MNLYSIQAITFDAGHTLFQPSPSVGSVYREVMLRHGLDNSENALELGFRKAFSHVSKNSEILDGEKREKDYWRRIVKETLKGLESPGEGFDSLFEELWTEFGHGRRWRTEAGTTATLKALKEARYRLSILSNWDKRLRIVVSDFGYENLFEHLFISSEIGFEKPHAGIFKHAAKRLELEPSRMLHVGDSLKEDLIGARNAGFQAALLSQENVEVPSGTIRIAKLSELIPLLERKVNALEDQPQ